MPRVKALDRISQSGDFEVRVERVHVAAAAVSHQLFAHIGDDAKVGKAGIEGVAERMKWEASELGPAQRAGPIMNLEGEVAWSLRECAPIRPLWIGA